MKKTIAFFDFDGTITTSDTMLELIKFHFGKKSFYTGLTFIAPVVVAMKAGMISRQKAKERLLTYFFKGMEINLFNSICKDFSEKKLPEILRKEAMDKIEFYKKENIEVVVVTASASNWVTRFCEENQLPLIASELEVVNNKLTGKLNGINCNAAEKVNRIKQKYDLQTFAEVHCYGDSSGDRELLQIATHPFFRKF